MKKITICIAAIAVMMFTAHAAFAGKVNKSANEAEITAIEDLHLGKSIEKVWTLRYSEQEIPVTIALHNAGNGKEYLVRSKFFEVIYAADKEGFGVKKMHGSMKQVRDKINYRVLNKQEMKNQCVLNPANISEEEALSLISNHLPDLLNSEYKHLLY